MQKIFNISVVVYFISYFLPFAEGLRGYELEFQLWYDMSEEQVPDANLATLWSFRWLATVLVLGLCWLRNAEVQQWFTLYTDKGLMDKLLLVFLLIFVLYPFLFEHLWWEWGGLIWACSAVCIAFSYQLLEPSKIPERHFSLEDHLVELKEEERGTLRINP